MVGPEGGDPTSQEKARGVCGLQQLGSDYLTSHGWFQSHWRGFNLNSEAHTRGSCSHRKAQLLPGTSRTCCLWHMMGEAGNQ